MLRPTRRAGAANRYQSPTGQPPQPCPASRGECASQSGSTGLRVAGTQGGARARKAAKLCAELVHCAASQPARAQDQLICCPVCILTVTQALLACTSPLQQAINGTDNTCTSGPTHTGLPKHQPRWLQLVQHPPCPLEDGRPPQEQWWRQQLTRSNFSSVEAQHVVVLSAALAAFFAASTAPAYCHSS